MAKPTAVKKAKAVVKKGKAATATNPVLTQFVSTENLAAKYRPRTLKDFYGQETAKAHIEGFIKKRNIPKVLGFFGPSGVGKTTLARMMAEIVNGGPFDIEEFNFGSERGIAEIRKIPERFRFLPTKTGHLRFFIFDEAHKLLNDAASALLKCIEEPPAHVVVILCTNEPEKLLATLRNRCEKVFLDLVDNEDMKALLTKVCKREDLDFGKYQEKILENIVVNADGVPREALQLLNAAHNVYTGCDGKSDKLAFKRIIASFGVEVDRVAVNVLIALYKGQPKLLVRAIYATKDYHALGFKLFNINECLVQKASGVGCYFSEPRKLAMRHIDIEQIGVVRALEVHRALVETRERMSAYLVNPEHTLLAVLSKVCRK